MTVAITGATGFIGTHLVHSLHNSGAKVLAIGRKGKNLHGTGIIPISSELSIKDMVQVFHKEEVNGVIHLASLFLKDHKECEIEALIDSNICLGVRVLEAAVKAHCGWFINTGTFWQHRHYRGYRPANLYAATKEAFEKLAEYYWRKYEIKFVTIKLNDTYGPGDPRPKIFNLWERSLLEDKVLPMSAGRQLVNFLYIDDVVSAYEATIRWLESTTGISRNGISFRASGTQTIPLREVAKIFESVAGRKLRIDWGALPYRPGEIMKPWKGGKRIPGWKPKVSLQDGISKMLEADRWTPA